MTGDEHIKWTMATKLEIESYTRNGTRELTYRQPWMQVIGSSWKFKLKRNQPGTIFKYKTRLVARGDMQEMDLNFVLASTLRYTSLRVILALVAYQDYEIEQMDVVTTFLNADVVSEIYMDQTQGVKKKAQHAQNGKRLLIWELGK
jgi:hypothetical protein